MNDLRGGRQLDHSFDSYSRDDAPRGRRSPVAAHDT